MTCQAVGKRETDRHIVHFAALCAVRALYQTLNIRRVEVLRNDVIRLLRFLLW